LTVVEEVTVDDKFFGRNSPQKLFLDARFSLSFSVL